MHLLQSTLFPEAGFPEDLYLGLRNARGVRIAVPAAPEGEREWLDLEAGDVLSTDTFFGSFYRAYWQRYTHAGAVAVSVRLEGAAEIRIFEETAPGRIRPLTRSQAEGSGTHLLGVPELLPDAAPGRLFVEIAALGPCRVRGIDFVTPEAPLRQTSLSIGLCTFNQEEWFARTLARVAGLARAHDAIRDVYVVNQGAPFAAPKIRALLEEPKIHAIAQRNLGGCGGFTRTLEEALRAPAPASHHLMMDDDIVLDARMILRALRFLDYCTEEIALGAGMLDSLRPSVMYEAGAFLSVENRIRPYCHNVDLADPAQLHHFNVPVATDYNAWWFCILPLDACRAAGLPAPVFIRGDDFEYGQRLARAGVPTVTLPGIAVWHEPFYVKPGGWQDYYDLRNRLIFGATYGEKVDQLSFAHVTGMITSAVLTHNYRAAELRLRAVEDFLKGPERLFARDPEDLHKEVMALSVANAPEALDSSVWKQRPAAFARTAPETMRGLIAGQFVAMLRTGFGPLRRCGMPVLVETDAHPRNTAGRAYVLTNAPRSFHLRFKPRRGRMWRLILRAALLGIRYRRARARVGREWAKGIPAYHRRDWWAALFASPARADDTGSPDTGSPDTASARKTT